MMKNILFLFCLILSFCSLAKEITLTTIKTTEITANEIDPSEITSTSIDVVIESQECLEQLKSKDLFENTYTSSDKYTKKYLNDYLNITNLEIQTEWLYTFQTNKSCNISFIRNFNTFKIISDLWLNTKNTNSYELLITNLNILKELKYDSVLLRFDGTENISNLVELATVVKTNNFNIFITYTGIQNIIHTWNPLNTKPSTIEKYLEALAPISTGIFLTWRDSSVHNKLLPMEYFNFICNTSRKYNSEILTYGEVYYGQVNPLRLRTMATVIPTNITGIVINNMGYTAYNQVYIVNKFFKQHIPNYNKLNKIGQVIGYDTYYASKSKIYMSIFEEYDYKKKVEKQFEKTGTSTVTMIHDGIDDYYTLENIYDTDDNILTDTKLQKLKN